MSRQRRAPRAVTSLALFAAVLGAPVAARAQACYGNISWQRVYTPFAQNPIPGADFSAGADTAIDAAGALTVAGAPQPLTMEHIVLPYTQDVQAKLVFANTSNSGIFGWFYWDQIANNPNFFDPVTQALVDRDGDGVMDFFQWKTATRPSDGLYVRTNPLNALPDILYDSPPAAIPFSDGGLYPHVPNLIETLIGGGGGIAFQLLDDDGDLRVANGYSATLLPLQRDAKTDEEGDGIPDYDVDGDGVVGDESDRTVDLGLIQGGREIVFFFVSYGGDQTIAGSPFVVSNTLVGLPGNSTESTRVIPYFSKSMLNGDSYQNGLAPGTNLATFDAGCPLSQTCNGQPGLMDAAALARLDTAAYQNLVMPSPTVVKVQTTVEGYMPHLVAIAPATDPNRWIFGVEDTPVLKAACPGCTENRRDYNDAVLLVQRIPGGFAQSQSISSDIPAADLANTMISKVRIAATASFPAPCPQPPATTPLDAGSTRIDIAWSVDGGASWYPVVFPVGTNGLQGKVTIDLLGAGISGNQLVWRASFASALEGCLPKLTSLSIGYQAMRAGTYQLTEPLPLGNVLVRAQFETPNAGWTGSDRLVRGHLPMNMLYDLDASPNVDYTDPANGTGPPLIWDAGPLLAARNPDPPPAAGGRTIFYHPGAVGALPGFVTGVVALDQAVLPGAGSCNAGGTGTRCARNPDGSYVYDFDGDSDVSDADADWLINWTRGWDGGNARLGRRWMLGGIVHGTPAVVGAPPQPWWFDDARDDNLPPAQKDSAALKNASTNFQNLHKDRRTLVMVGAQDGMFHAFDAGLYEYGDDPTTQVVESKGYFAHPSNVVGTPRDYGDGSELWAFVPAAELGQLKNNPPRTAGRVVGESRATADAAVSVADACLKAPAAVASAVAPFCAFMTVAVAQQTRSHPFVTALDVTDANSKSMGAAPRALWAQDWPLGDPVPLPWDEQPQGSEWGPALGPILTAAAGRAFYAVLSSGIAATPMQKLMVYFIDLSTGTTAAKLRVNVAGNGIDCSPATTGGVLGSAGSPALVDSDRDGLIDRVYLADTNGCVYKINTQPAPGLPPSVCPIAATGESVWAPIAVRTPTDVNQRVEIFVGGGDNPDTFDLLDGTTAPPAGGYHLFGYEDDDPTGACSVARSLFTVPLRPAGAPATAVHKLWSAPSFTADAVLVATSVGDQLDPCNQDPANNGVIEGWYLQPDQNGVMMMLFAPVVLAAGSGAGGVRAYDGHIFANALNGTTTVIGQPNHWNLTPIIGATRAFGVPLWIER